MLQRAASNAYSWWWAGHVRTKQTKWLEQSLQDVEENVQNMLKIIEQEGDSFAKRAEMYYKKRPELINLVEENYRAYRALADRFDHLSTELQNANTTIASVFPERAELAMDDDDDENAPPRNFDSLSQYSSENVPKPPEYPPQPKNDVKKMSKKGGSSSDDTNNNKEGSKSGLTKTEAFEEIDKLQKEILALQTVKEFVKSSYENGISKYDEIESRLVDLQERVFSLQDEFCVEQIIEDDEARSLMVEAALKSCDEALSHLQEKQRKSTDEAREEFQKVENAREKLKFLREKFLSDKDEGTKASKSQQRAAFEESQQEFDELREKIKAHFNERSKESLTVTEMVEKIDELVNKVISLETAVSSQTALIDRMKNDSEDLQTQIQTLENEKETLISGTDTLKNKLSSLEEEVNRLQELNKKFQNENNHLRACFAETRCSLDHLSEKLHSVKPDEDLESMELSHGEDYSSYGFKTPERSEKYFDFRKVGESSSNEKSLDKLENATRTRTYGSVESDGIFMNEYNGLVKNLKDAKRKITDLERKNQEILFEKTAEITDLKSTVAKRDVTIRCLIQKLKLFQVNLNENEDFQEENSENNLEMILMDQPQFSPQIEDKLRMNIDYLLDDNLSFWFKFSTSFQQIHKFKMAFDDLQGDIIKVKEKEKEKADSTADIKSDLRPIYKHLREIETEITIWSKQSSILKDELQDRYTTLCKIEGDITKALKASPDDENEKNISAHKAAKFQGEVSNMKQECYKVRKELQAGFEHVSNLKQEIEKTFTKLDEDFEAEKQNNYNYNYNKNDQEQFKNSTRGARVPLRTFIFGAKPKKKMSLFSLIHSRRKHEFKGCGL